MAAIQFSGNSSCKTLLPFSLVFLPIFILFFCNRNPQLPSIESAAELPGPVGPDRTDLSHISFGLISSVKKWPRRRGYVEAWWRPNRTRGFVFLDRAPPPELLPWPDTAPPYGIVDAGPRIVNGILETLRQQHDGGGGVRVRWIVIGYDDSVFFAENIAAVLAEYDHTKYYYLGGRSETVPPDYQFSFDHVFGGGGIVPSYPLAAGLAQNVDGCLQRYGRIGSPEFTITACIFDMGASLTPHKGIHQVDLSGDVSGYLSTHPKAPLLAFCHIAAVDPIYPNMDGVKSMRHLMKAAAADQSRLLQQSICHHRRINWSLSVAWGYSVHIYDSIKPRSYLQTPIQTFQPPPSHSDSDRPVYAFDTRPVPTDPCDSPHVFFFESVHRSVCGHWFVTRYVRSEPRGTPPCSAGGNHPADHVTRIEVYSPVEKRPQVDRCECCDVARVGDCQVDIKYRECGIDEAIA